MEIPNELHEGLTGEHEPKRRHCPGIKSTKCLSRTPIITICYYPFKPSIKPFLKTFRVDLLFSVCVPSSCTAQDVKSHIDIALNSVNASSFVSESNCSSNVSSPLKMKEWIAIFLIGLIVVLVILSTVYENSCLESEKNNLLCTFSLETNVRQMLSTQTTPAALTCLNGLRVIAMIWVILGHRMLQMISFPSIRPKTIIEVSWVAWLLLNKELDVIGVISCECLIWFHSDEHDSRFHESSLQHQISDAARKRTVNWS
ncbi:hypothetical protein J6590_041543 [Homalodisca vitripennis]|nr:hypothetical protein J6590_041543 [Homalodisca vitripennis]